MEKTNIEYTNFFEEVVDRLTNAKSSILAAKSLIQDTELVKKPTKKVLLGRIDNIFAESNAIVDKLGALGRVK